MVILVHVRSNIVTVTRQAVIANDQLAIYGVTLYEVLYGRHVCDS